MCGTERGKRARMKGAETGGVETRGTGKGRKTHFASLGDPENSAQTFYPGGAKKACAASQGDNGAT